MLFKTDSIIRELNKERLTNNITLFVNELKADCMSWNDNSLEPIIFAKLIKQSGLNTNIFESVTQIIKISLDPAKDVQLKTRFLLLVPELFTAASSVTGDTEASNGETFLVECFDALVTDMILPNIVWRAGRANSSVRMTATASLVLILQIESVKKIQPCQETLDQLFKLIQSCLDDDNKSTRFYACKIFLNVLHTFGARFDKDKLHKLYPDLIKRLDDQSEDIRFEVIKVFNRYCQCLHGNYDKQLYKVHLQTIDENLILYLDDSNLEIQNRIFGNFASS